MTAKPTREQLEAAHCWELDDLIPSRPAMTAFRQGLRYHQAMWREAHGHPIGSQPIAPRPGEDKVRPVGNRIALDDAIETGATFLSAGALAAARARTATKEAHQTFDRQRLWAELLWSPTFGINLFGDLASDHQLATRAVRAWWPDATGTVEAVRFAHSPGRFDPTFTNGLRTFDAAIELDRGDGTHGVIGMATMLHDRIKSETPKPENLARYVEIAERSRVFAPGAIDALKGRSEHAVMWLEHLLLSSMLQHPSGRWTWGRYVVVYPAGNPDAADLIRRYRGFLADDTTFDAITLEALLAADVLPAATATALRERYIPT